MQLRTQPSRTILWDFLAFNYSKRGLIMAVETRVPCIIDAMSEGLEG